MSYWEDLLGFGRDSTPRDSVSENDSLDAFRYAMGPKNPMGKSDLLDELRRIQAQRRQRQDQQQYEFQRAQAQMAEQMQQHQYDQLRASLGQMNQLGALQSQQAALAAVGIGTAQQVAVLRDPDRDRPAQAAPKKKTIDLVEPGQRKIETE